MKIFLIALFLLSLSQKVLAQSDESSIVGQHPEGVEEPLTERDGSFYQEAIAQKESLLAQNTIELLDLYIQFFRKAEQYQLIGMEEIDMDSLEENWKILVEIRQFIEDIKAELARLQRMNAFVKALKENPSYELSSSATLRVLEEGISQNQEELEVLIDSYNLSADILLMSYRGLYGMLLERNSSVSKGMIGGQE